MSQRAGMGTSQHYRNNSGSQYSDISDDAQAQYNYAHGVDATVDTGALEGSMALPQGSVRQIPQLARVQSDMGSTGRKAPPPPVAPRRHAPAPPMPQRAPRRVLRRTIYKFSADDEGELPMDKGDIVEVTDRIDDGWWQGRLVHSVAGAQVGGTGIFPSNYTEECEESDVPPQIPLKATASPNLHQRSGSFQGALKPPATYRSQTTPDDVRAPPNSSHQRTASNAPPPAAAKQCACGCNDYSQNAFKGSGCKNCFHNH
ncbi:GRB2- adapter protein 2 [Coemansia sp. RSA 1836]|nr:GRB2- adapter protein 2 [Coemansia sp. RSA 1836]